jgi:hypothetical protein
MASECGERDGDREIVGNWALHLPPRGLGRRAGIDVSDASADLDGCVH